MPQSLQARLWMPDYSRNHFGVWNFGVENPGCLCHCIPGLSTEPGGFWRGHAKNPVSNRVLLWYHPPPWPGTEDGAPRHWIPHKWKGHPRGRFLTLGGANPLLLSQPGRPTRATYCTAAVFWIVRILLLINQRPSLHFETSEHGCIAVLNFPTFS